MDPSNTEQARAWDGDEGAYWAAHAERFEQSLARYDEALLTAARIAPADRVLDVGCGTGKSSRDAARLATAGSVLGVDLSTRMVEVARETAARQRLRNLRFEHADAQVHPFDAAAFDVAISRTGAMFFGDPVAAFGNIVRALRPGGRLVLLVWAPPPQNEWIMEITTAFAAGREMPAPPPDAPGPFSLSNPQRVRAVLTAAGLAEPEIQALQEPMWFGPDAADAHRFLVGLTGWMLEGLDDARRARALDDLRASMEAHDTADGVYFGSAMWLVTTRRAA